MKMFARAGLVLSALMMLAAPAVAADLYTVLVWDPRFPGRDPMRITTTATAAAALVQSGVAAPADSGQYGYLASLSLGGATVTPPAGNASGSMILDFTDPADAVAAL